MSYRSFADLGGGKDDRPVEPEPDGAAFHADWEPRAMALTVAMGATGLWNIDQSRSARETLADYSNLGYYQVWLAALEELIRTTGILEKPAPVPAPVLRAADVASVLRRGSTTLRPSPAPARFSVGQPVRTQAGEIDHHTRLPRYARGKIGTVERIHGAHVFADSNARGEGEAPQWLYTVAFDGAELWGEPGCLQTVSVDAFESYLTPA